MLTNVSYTYPPATEPTKNIHFSIEMTFAVHVVDITHDSFTFCQFESITFNSQIIDISIRKFWPQKIYFEILGFGDIRK